MGYPVFNCAVEKDHNPPLDPQAEQYFQQAHTFEKAQGMKNWPAVIRLYQQAIEKNHWKAMHNLAALYRSGKNPSKAYAGIDKDQNKMLNLYARMVELEVPLGYYNWAVAVERGQVKTANKTDASSYMFRAAELGSPLAQVRLGNYFSFQLPRGKQRDDLADQYFRCAGRQDNPEALMEVAEFYDISKKNKALAAFYYQKAASFGNTAAIMQLEGTFKENPISGYDLGYVANPILSTMYKDMYDQVQANRDLKFPNLLKDHPLPRHPTQGYDADNPDIRPQ